MHDAKLVHEELCSIARVRLELHAREARLLVLAEELELWREFGCAHMHEYLERFCDLHPRTGREYLRVARALAELPVMRAALDSRRIHYSTARELTRVATPETEAAWLRAVEGMTAREVEEEVAGHQAGDGPQDPKNPNRLVKLVLDVRESTFALFLEARRRYIDERGDQLSDDEVVLAMCRESVFAVGANDDARADADASATGRGGADDAALEDATRDGDRDCDLEDGARRAVIDPRIPPYRLSITTCRACAKSYLNAGGRQTLVPPALVDAARCDARFIGDLEADLPPRAISSVTPRMREHVLERDGHTCTVPGCRSKRFLDAHHIQLESRGGPTVAWNITTLCWGHHHLLHDGKLAVAGRAPHHLVWTWPEEPARSSTRDRGGPRGPQCAAP